MGCKTFPVFFKLSFFQVLLIENDLLSVQILYLSTTLDSFAEERGSDKKQRDWAPR